jgi:hypothetical protein
MSNPVAPTLTGSNIIPINTPATVGTLEGLDHWLKDFQKYETILVSSHSCLNA